MKYIDENKESKWPFLTFIYIYIMEFVVIIESLPRGYDGKWPRQEGSGLRMTQNILTI